MNVILIAVATTALGVDIGWQPLSDGGSEYIIQIEPQLLTTLKNGNDLTSEVPAWLNVRRYRITVGTGELPQDPKQPPAEPARAQSRSAPAAKDPRTEQPSAADENAFKTQADRPTGSAANAPGSTGGTAAKGPALGNPTEAAGNDETIFKSHGSFPSLKPIDPASEAPRLPAKQPAHAGEQPPAELSPDPRSGPLAGQRVTFDDHAGGSHRAAKPPHMAADAETPAHTAEAAPASKPWLPLVLTILALLVSLGGNIYLGWVAWEARYRYRGLVDKFGATSPA